MIWNNEDYLHLIDVSKSGRFAPKDWLAFATSESGLNPRIVNKNGGAAGLWQAMPATLKWLGWVPGNIDFDAVNGSFYAANIKTQIDWSLKYLNHWREHFHIQGWNCARDMYLANFMPMHLPHKDEKEHVIIDGLKWREGYRVNQGFDRNANGFITVGDLQSAIDRAKTTGVYKAASATIDSLINIPK